ncbi:SMI1/KNR4 family protein [Streptomyces sp. NPDC051954]|uniref:SMI1/KNR4 family protein n=1 Tax=Streptomyces sp. NPDC051954 TaxID=3155524 RepID=UPI0034263072
MLPPPAPEADIHEVEQELDLTVPPGLKVFHRLRNGTGHLADFGWTPEPETGLPPARTGDGLAVADEARDPPGAAPADLERGPHTIGRPADPAMRYLAFAATDRSGLYGLFADYLIEVADALHETRDVEYADERQDTTVPGLVDQALVWDGPVYPMDPDWTRPCPPATYSTC